MNKSEQIAFSFSKVPIDLAIELAFQLGMAYKDLWIKADLDNAINFNDFQHAKGCGAQVKLKGTMEDLPKILSYRTDKEKIIIERLNDIAGDKKRLIEICTS
jgi:hypothetical protein